MKMKKSTLIFFILGFLFFAGAIALEFCSDAKASAPGVWVCMAVSENSPNPDYNCDATARHTNRKKAESKALELCKNKCAKDLRCRVQACARAR